MRYIISVLLSLLFPVFLLSSCSTSTTDNISILDTLGSADNFTFRGIEWGSSSEEVFLNEGFSENEVTFQDGGNVVTAPIEAAFEDIDIPFQILYYFDNDRFYKGTYKATYNDKEKIIIDCENIATIFINYFGEPSTGNVEDFNTHSDSSSVEWKSAKGNLVELTIYTSAYLTEETSSIYVLEILVSDPQTIGLNIQ